MDAALEQALRGIRLIVMDVDGVLTNGAIQLVPLANAPDSAVVEVKTFDVKDGLAIRWASRVGLTTALLTSRASPAVLRRAKELEIGHVVTGSGEKGAAFLDICRRAGVSASEAAYLGDDLPDLAPMRLAGVAIAPSDAAGEVREAATWITEAAGGRGVAREAIEAILRAQGLWLRVVAAHGGDAE